MTIVAVPRYVFEVVAPLIQQLTTASQLAHLDHAIRFGDDGTVVAAGADNVEALELVVPRWPGLSDLVVDRAVVRISGRRIDVSPVEEVKSGTSPSVRLRGRPGALRRIELRGLTIDPAGAGEEVVLHASTGSPSRWRWRATADGIERDTANGSNPVHVMVRPTGSPPVTASPHYAMPDNASGLYGPVLGGSSVRLDDPRPGSATVHFDPPIAASDVELFVGANPGKGRHGGLPHEAVGLAWSADAVVATWSAAPHDVTLTATAGGTPVTVAELPGELPTALAMIDLTAAARSVLRDALAVGADDLVLSVGATSTTAGELAGDTIQLDARYRHDAVGADGLNLDILGSPVTATVELPPDLVPAVLTMTLDGRFGPARLVTSADDADPLTRQGTDLRGTNRVTRRVALVGIERNRPLVRVGLLCGADAAAEILVQVCRDEQGRPGPPVSDPVALHLDPGAAAWHRAELSASTADGDPKVWVTAWATSGAARWYGTPVVEPVDADIDVLISLDDGTTWDIADVRPAVQLHVETTPEPEPIELRSLLGLVAPDVLALPAARTRVEAPALPAARLAGGTVPSDLAGPARSASFRVERVSPISSDALAALAPAGAIPLRFTCRRDVNLRVLDVEATYDPWRKP